MTGRGTQETTIKSGINNVPRPHMSSRAVLSLLIVILFARELILFPVLRFISFSIICLIKSEAQGRAPAAY